MCIAIAAQCRLLTFCARYIDSSSKAKSNVEQDAAIAFMHSTLRSHQKYIIKPSLCY